MPLGYDPYHSAKLWLPVIFFYEGLMEKSELLSWYWDVVTASNEALGNGEHEYYAGLEEWRQALKSEAGL